MDISTMKPKKTYKNIIRWNDKPIHDNCVSILKHKNHELIVTNGMVINVFYN